MTFDFARFYNETVGQTTGQHNMTIEGWREVVTKSVSDQSTMNLLVKLLYKQNEAKNRLTEYFGCSGG